MYNCTTCLVVMKIVVDTSVIIAVITNEAHKKELVALTKGAALVAPEALHWEIGNAFSAMLKRKRIQVEQALSALKYYQKIPIRRYNVELGFALEISNQLNIYAYDAYFIACAFQLGSPLLSLDRQLLRNAQSYGVKVLEVSK